MGRPVTRYRLINPSPERWAQMALAFTKYIPEFKLLLKSPSDWYQAPFPEVVLLWLRNEAIIFSRTLSICLDCNLAPALAPQKWSRSGPKSFRNMYSLYLAADAEIADHTHVFKILKCCLIDAMLAVFQPVFEYEPGPGHNNNNNNSTSMQPYHYDTDGNENDLMLSPETGTEKPGHFFKKKTNVVRIGSWPFFPGFLGNLSGLVSLVVRLAYPGSFSCLF